MAGMQELDSTLGDRLAKALVVGRWSVEDVAQRSKLGAAKVRGMLSAEWAGHRDVVAVAEALSIDPRWLATGRASPAAEAALARLELVAVRTPLEQGPALRNVELLDTRIAAVLLLTPQPEIAPFVCRYCGCTPDAACECGCEWVDREATICSACLEPAEEDDEDQAQAA